MSGTKIPNLSNVFREQNTLILVCAYHACVTQFLKIRAISSKLRRCRAAIWQGEMRHVQPVVSVADLLSFQVLDHEISSW